MAPASRPPPSSEGRIAVRTAPRQLGRYALHGEIAAGGMAAVHLGRLLGPVGFARTVAIKRLHPQFAKDPSFVAMFLDEARLAARVRHPNVVATLDVVSMEDELFLVMDYVAGESLARLTKLSKSRDEPIPPEIAIAVTVQALNGLHAAHEATSERGKALEIVHRDVSPQNILVGVDGVARVLDFGIAKATSRLSVTTEGQLKGKIPYMAPEQIELQDVDRRVDVYSAAVVLWETLTGQRLFEGDHPARQMKAVLTGPVARPSELLSGLPSKIDDIVLKGLARDPNERYATARDMAIALEGTGMVASNRAVGEWVERTARKALETRADVVAAIEGASEVGIDASLAKKPDPEDVETTAYKGPVRVVDQEASSIVVTHGSTIPDPVVRKRRVFIVAAAAAVLLIGGVSWGLTRGESRPPGQTNASGGEPTTSAPPAPTPTPIVTTPPSPAVSATATTVAAPAKPSVSTIKKTHAPTTDKKQGCNPPYTVDNQGVRVPKMHCL